MILLDTNVLSELIGPKVNPKVQDWYISQSADEIYTSVVTLFEMHFGMMRLPEGEKRRALVAVLDHLFVGQFKQRTLSFDERSARLSAELRATCCAIGHIMSVPDAQIAGIAAREGAVLATRDVNDFKHCGLTLINPWET